jgi:glucose-6-phosphate isomerase
MLSSNIIFKNFKIKNSNLNQKKKILKILKNLLSEKNEILNSLDSSYKSSYRKSFLLKLKKFKRFKLIGMGGSILGARAIYNFLSPKIKNFFFFDNFSYNSKMKLNLKKKNLNLIISKSGNTLETITNSNVLINNQETNIFITENKKSYLMDLANQMKSEVVHHNNFIGGRYSVLSEVGMLPAELMGFKPSNFRKLNDLIKSKSFLNSLVQNVSNILSLNKSGKSNSIILNYDERSNDLLYWYQQLVAESLGKKSKGILPIISNMPTDNHSVMQYYLDGVKNHFFTFFFTAEKSLSKIKNNRLLKSHYYLKNRNLNDISYSQYIATVKVLDKKKIPFRSFMIKKRSEEILGELFTFFILETILLGRAMKINPFDQPSVELIKKETKKVLVNF